MCEINSLDPCIRSKVSLSHLLNKLLLNETEKILIDIFNRIRDKNFSEMRLKM